MTTFCFINQVRGIRLDKFLVEQRADLSRSYIQKLITENYVSVNDAPAKAGRHLDKDDRVTLALADPIASLTDLTPLTIVYEDEDIAVIDKPARLVVHPAAGHPDRTLFNSLIARFSDLSEKDSLRSGIVHRLDKDTSGLMVVAKNDASLSALQKQFKNRSVTRKYFVLVYGHVKSQDGEITASIGRDPILHRRMAIVTDGKEATTLFHVVQYLGKYTLLELSLVTGRTHQIRLHLAAIGYPVVGDATYGKKDDILQRQFVHASILGFNLPVSGKYKEFKSELPADLKQVLEQISSN